MYEVNVEIEGITPLLMNRFIEDEEIPKKKGEQKETEEDAKKRLYLNEKGEIIVPSEWLLRAMDRVSSEFKVEGMKRATYKSLLAGNIFIEPEAIKIEPQEWIVDKRSVVIPATRGRIMKYRPKFNQGWKLKFKIKVFDDRIKKEVLYHILVEAGRRAGIGDGRTIGMGRFIVKSFEKEKGD